MAVDLSLYQDREQSYVKHLFLTKYLESAAFKVLQGRSPIFNFVDAFAGPWKVSDEDKYSDASFHQAINTLETVRATLARMGRVGIRIRFCFCEKRAESFEKLKSYAERNKKFEIHVFHGSFEDKLDEISRRLPDGFTFTFIDPTGWKIQNSRIFEYLRAHNGEFLLNFMSDHINRHVEYSKVVESFGQFLADPNWAEDFAKTDTDLSNEERVLAMLKKKMFEAGIAKYLPDFSILVPRKERIKMRLILGTNSSHGLELFRDTQFNVERAEIKVRSNLQVGDSPQPALFSEEYRAEIEQQHEGVGSKKHLLGCASIIKNELSITSSLSAREIEISLMEKIPIKATQVRKLLNQMKKQREIHFELEARQRVAQPETRVTIPR